MRVLIAAGGTGGHITPGLAIADYIKSRDKHSEFLFVGSRKGMEKDMVPRAGYDLEFIEILGFKRKISLEFFKQNVRTLYLMRSAIQTSKDIINAFEPDIVIGTGGYVSGPVLFAAAKVGVPTLIHESNAYPGLASKLLAHYVDCVCLSFKSTKSYFKNSKRVVLTGNPLRQELFNISKAAARERLGIHNDNPLIVASGGSLGAEGFNHAVMQFINKTKVSTSFNMIFGTGEAHFNDIMLQVATVFKSFPKHITVVPFIHDMSAALVAADLVIGRGGAITLSEITALQKPSVLIPSPNVTNNHQEYNARALHDAGAAIMFTERKLEKDNCAGFVTTIAELLSDPKRLRDMSNSAKSVGITDGVQQIYDQAKKLMRKW